MEGEGVGKHHMAKFLARICPSGKFPRLQIYCTDGMTTFNIENN
jgi:hypothetical protein